MTAELNIPEDIEQIFEKPQNFKPRPCPYLFFDDEEDDFMYFKW
jgi:hypothetical protein